MAVLTRLPPIPVITIVYAPVGVVAEVDIVIVSLHVGLQLPPLKATILPTGISPEADNDTGCLVPLNKLILTVVVVLLPGVTLPLVGVTEREKSKGVGAGVQAIV